MFVFGDSGLETGCGDGHGSEPVRGIASLEDRIGEGGGAHGEALSRTMKLPVAENHLMVMEILANSGRVDL